MKIFFKKIYITIFLINILIIPNKALSKETKIEYRDVHKSTLTNDVQYFPPQERVY